MMSWERWPPHAIHRLPQKLPQVPTLDSSASRPADHDQPTHSVRWLTSTGCFSSVWDVRLRPNFPQWKPGYDRGKEPPEACAANTAQLAQSSRQSRLASNPLLLLKASFSPQSPPPLGALVSHSGSLAPQKSNSSASRARRMLIRTSCLFRPLRPPDLPAEGTAATPKIYFSKSNQTWRKPGKMETPMNGSPAPFLELIITQCPIASPVAGRTSSAC